MDLSSGTRFPLGSQSICEGSILFAGRLCLGSLGYLVIKMTAGEALQGVSFRFGAPHFERVLDTAPQWVKKDLGKFSLKNKRQGKMV